MLDKVLGAFIDKEGSIKETIINTLDNLSEELDCGFEDLFVTIQPVNEDFDFKMYVYQKINGKHIFIREITLKEIVNN